MKTTDPDLLRKSDGPGGPGLPAQRPAPATPPPSSEGQSKTGGTLNVFSHGVLVIWAFLVAMPLTANR